MTEMVRYAVLCTKYPDHTDAHGTGVAIRICGHVLGYTKTHRRTWLDDYQPKRRTHVYLGIDKLV